MKTLFFGFILLLITTFSFAQERVGINIPSPAFTLDVRSTATNQSGVFNLANSDSKYFIRLYSGSSIDPNPYILWKNNRPFRFLINEFNPLEVARFDDSGNLGIGTDSPPEKLSVDGNVDITGDLKITGEIAPHGTSGSEGQLLQSDGNGGMSWISPCNYKHFKGFRLDDTWTVPAGVAEILVELWGGGGGGSAGAGGGGGAYLIGIMPVDPGDTLTIDIGAGGDGGTGGGDGVEGEATFVYNGIAYYKAQQGYGATSGPGQAGIIGSSNYGVYNEYRSVPGENGKRTTVTYAQKNATTFVRIINYGNGGNSGNSIVGGGQGAYRVENEDTGASIKQYYGIFALKGGGGGGKYNGGYSGGAGYVIIWWK